MASANEIDPNTVVPVQWGTQWQMEQAYEVIIGLKIDPYCLATDPRGDSVMIKYLKLYEYKCNVVPQNILAW